MWSWRATSLTADEGDDGVGKSSGAIEDAAIILTLGLFEGYRGPSLTPRASGGEREVNPFEAVINHAAQYTKTTCRLILTKGLRAAVYVMHRSPSNKLGVPKDLVV